MKKILLTAILILSTIFVFAEKKLIRVVDKHTQEELIGATVIVGDSTYYTDFDGFVLIDVEKDSTIKVEYPSYVTKSINDDTEIIELDSK